MCTDDVCTDRGKSVFGAVFCLFLFCSLPCLVYLGHSSVSFFCYSAVAITQPFGFGIHSYLYAFLVVQLASDSLLYPLPCQPFHPFSALAHPTNNHFPLRLPKADQDSSTSVPALLLHTPQAFPEHSLPSPIPPYLLSFNHSSGSGNRRLVFSPISKSNVNITHQHHSHAKHQKHLNRKYITCRHPTRPINYTRTSGGFPTSRPSPPSASVRDPSPDYCA